MKKILLISALLAAPAWTPALAQDQGDPNPPTLQQNGRPVAPLPKVAEQPGATQGSGTIPRASPSPSTGDTSGPAAAGGGLVQPPTVVQKDNPAAQRNASPEGVAGPSGASAGSPGIEGKAGTQAGKEWQPPEELQRKAAPRS
jgi:hypothetical protein